MMTSVGLVALLQASNGLRFRCGAVVDTIVEDRRKPPRYSPGLGTPPCTGSPRCPSQANTRRPPDARASAAWVASSAASRAWGTGSLRLCRREAFGMPSRQPERQGLARLTHRRRGSAGSRRRRWVIRSMRRSMIAPRVEERREAVAVAGEQVRCRACRAGHRRPGRTGGSAPPTRFVRRAPTTLKRYLTRGLSAPSGRRS